MAPRQDFVDAPLTGPASNRIPFVQGLRAVAVLLVVVYHVGLGISGGFVGVDVFFVISGFVITGVLLRDRGRNGRVDLRRFYRRRIRRILPALATMIAVTVVLSALLQSPFGAQQTAAKAAIGASVSVANIVLYTLTLGYFGAEPSTIPFLHTWSLAVEEQFYLVIPSLIVGGLWWARRRQRDRRLGVAIVLVGVLLASFALSLALSYGDFARIKSETAIAFFFAPTRAWEFCAGGLVAVWWPGRSPLSRRVASVVGLIAAGIVIASARWPSMPERCSRVSPLSRPCSERSSCWSPARRRRR